MDEVRSEKRGVTVDRRVPMDAEGRWVPKSDDGSGSVLVVAIMAALLALLSLLAPLVTVLDTRQRAGGAADAAALAAADVAVGLEPGIPCQRAALLASVNDASLAACRVDGVVVTVRVVIPVLGFPVAAVASAGPPGSVTN